MGFLGPIGDAVGGAFHAVTSTVSSVVNDIKTANFDWKTIASIAVGTAVFVGLTVLTGGADLPVLATLLIAGAGSGVAGQLTYDLLAQHKPGLDVLYAGVVSAGLTVFGAGVGRLVAPVIGNVLERTGVTALVSRSPIGQLFADAGEAEGGILGNLGKLVGLVKDGKVGTPKILDPDFYDGGGQPAEMPKLPLAPRRVRVPVPDAAPSTPGFTRELDRIGRSE